VDISLFPGASPVKPGDLLRLSNQQFIRIYSDELCESRDSYGVGSDVFLHLGESRSASGEHVTKVLTPRGVRWIHSSDLELVT
jgi:hypothetical protein